MDHLVNVEWQKIHLGRLALALGTTSLFENLLYHPWWVLKTREQVEHSNPSKSVLQNSIDLAQRIWRKEGVRALYRGFWAGSVGSLPSAYIYLVTYHKTKHDLCKSNIPASVKSCAPFIAGVTAETASIGFFVPIDVITQRMQLHDTAGRNAFHVARDIIRHEGISGMYRGTFLTVLKLGLGSGTWWLAYEQLKVMISAITGKPSSSATGIAAGFLAGLLSTVITNPLDVVKTRIQLQFSDSKGAVYKKTWDAFKTIWKNERWAGLNRGLAPKLISQGPLSAVWAVIYEMVLKYSIAPSADEK